MKPGQSGQAAGRFSQNMSSPTSSQPQGYSLSFSSQEQSYSLSLNPANPYPCQFCDKAFSRLSYLKRHEQVHSDKMPFKCDYCNRLFKHKRSRDRHVRLHTGDKKYQCTVCSAAFSRSDHLKIHLKTHNSSKPYQCLICCRGYTTTAALTAHTQTHHRNQEQPKDKEFRCLQCTSSFSSASELQIHILTHSAALLQRQKTFQCNYCAELCNGHEALVSHIEHCHAKDKRNKCPICSECFLSVEQLYQHMSTHAAGMPTMQMFRCPYCSKNDFCSLAMLQVHIDTIHGDKRQSHLCQFCNQEFPAVFNLMEHISSVHDKELQNLVKSSMPSLVPGLRWPCRYCMMQFDDQFKLEGHMKAVHTFTEFLSDHNRFFCQHCTMSFPNPYILAEHVRVIHNLALASPITCGICARDFPNEHILQQHLLLDHRLSEKQIFICVYCKDTFQTENELKDHIETKHAFIPPKSMSQEEMHHMPVSHPSQVMMTEIQTSASSLGLHPLSASLPTMMEEKISPHMSGTSPLSKKTPSLIPLPATVRRGFSCSQCDKSFPSLLDFQSHLKSHLDLFLKKYPCTECDLEFTSEDIQVNHILTHYMDAKLEYNCQKCEKIFSKADELQKHLFDIHAHHLYRCSLCKEIFDSKVAIQVHFAIKHSHESKSFRCLKCNVSLESESELRKHVATAHLNFSISRAYQCMFCAEAFMTETELQNHVAEHAKLYKCDYCKEGFQMSSLLEEHVLMKHSTSHTSTSSRQTSPSNIKVKQEPDSDKDEHGSTPRSRPDSGRSSGSYHGGVTMKESTVALSEQGGYHCDECNLSFQYEEQLNDHCATGHSRTSPPGNKPANSPTKDSAADPVTNLCKFCSAKFPSEYEMHCHVAGHILLQNVPKCTFCNAVFASPSNLAAHMFEHKNTNMGNMCTFCQTLMKNEAEYFCHAYMHVLKAANKPISHVECIVCKQPLTSVIELNIHSRYHTQITASSTHLYRCSVCYRTFDTKDELSCKMDGNGCPCYICKDCLNSFPSFIPMALPNTCAPTYPCSQCNMRFDSQFALESHFDSHIRSMRCGAASISPDAMIGAEASSDFDAHIPTHVMMDLNPLECKMCREDFESELDLQCHLIDHSYSGKELQCPVCNVAFNSTKSLQLHVTEHGQEALKLVCSICNQRFIFEAELQNHAFCHSSTKNNENVCLECDRSFTSGVNLANHMKIHVMKDNTYKCSLCPEVFARTVDMQQHYFANHSENDLGSQKQNFKCSQCEETFPCMSNLQGHMRIHTQSKTYSCPECHKVFALARNLTIHMRSHSGERPYQCPLCDKRFARKENRKVHLKSHNGIRPFMCPHCGKMFSRKCHVKDHMRTHSVLATQQCPACPETFTLEKNLKRHVRRAHNFSDNGEAESESNDTNSSDLSMDAVDVDMADIDSIMLNAADEDDPDDIAENEDDCVGMENGLDDDIDLLTDANNHCDDIDRSFDCEDVNGKHVNGGDNLNETVDSHKPVSLVSDSSRPNVVTPYSCHQSPLSSTSPTSSKSSKSFTSHSMDVILSSARTKPATNQDQSGDILTNTL